MVDGYHKVVNCDNGYSVSIVSSSFSYGGDKGLFEVAVMYDGEIVYDTLVTDDVVGYLDFQGVADVIRQVENLPRRKPL